MGIYSGRGCEFLLLAKFSKFVHKSQSQVCPSVPRGSREGMFQDSISVCARSESSFSGFYLPI